MTLKAAYFQAVGFPDTATIRRSDLLGARAAWGGFMTAVDIDASQFHIPPKEIPDILPQHLLMLKVAHQAMLDAGMDLRSMRPRMGAVIGMGVDPAFGPVIWFGHGGKAVDVIHDQALALPPLNLHLAREVMARTRIFRLLKGFGLHGASPRKAGSAMTLDPGSPRSSRKVPRQVTSALMTPASGST